ncbi:MAG: hypothetical protein ACRD19_12060 [Terriglobia bacterium]
MKEYISFDSHKHYSLVEREEVQSGKVRQYRVEHVPGTIRRALAGCEPGTPVALTATTATPSGRKRAQHGFCLGGTPGKQEAGISRTFGSHGRHPFHILEYCRHGGRKLNANLSRLPKSSF